MKNLIIAAVAFAALSGVAVAAERDHDLRLSEPTVNVVRDGSVPQSFISQYSTQKSDGTALSDAEIRRLDAKNGSRG